MNYFIQSNPPSLSLSLYGNIPRPLMKLTTLALLQHMAVPSIVGHRYTVSILANFHITRRYQPFLLRLRLAAFPHTASISVCAFSTGQHVFHGSLLPDVSVQKCDQFVARESEGQVGILSWGPGHVWRTDTLQRHSCLAIFIPEYTLY